MRPAGLVLFLTQGASLATWDEAGILEREVALYRSLAPRVGGVALASYGGPEELRYAERLGHVELLPNRLRLPARAYARAVALAHARTLARAGVLKTNQVVGGLAAAHAARLYGRPLVARCGYLWSEVVEHAHGAESLRHRRVARYERRVFAAADTVTVTTPRLARRVRERYGVRTERLAVVPNYVDTERFAPTEGTPEAGALVFVGRLAPEKNLPAVLDALAGLDGASLTIVGDGPDRAALERHAARLELDVRFTGRLSHELLPAVLNAAQALVLPSLYEGQPKVALEAMACGLPVLGADVQGIREVVGDGETGLLSGTGAAELRASIETLLGDEALRRRLGAAAREAAGEYSLGRVVELELDVLDAARRSRARR